jgi:hypothetical protein
MQANSGTFALMRYVLALWLTLLCGPCSAQHLETPFERSGGKQTTTYAECIRFYEALQARTGRIRLDSTGLTDAGYPLHTIVYPVARTDESTLTILINNGIHPGEPDGIDACMMLLRDIAEDRLNVPQGIRLVVIPIYNIGGALNRNSSTRVNQAGPESYGFRGNSQDLDLNRDFCKMDSREAMLFAQIFHRYKPAVFVDNHVSDGADYQHVMTLLSTQYDKLGGRLGKYFRNTLDPALYKEMERAGFPMAPYVNAEETPEKGWTAFFDPPRFSSGYAALYNTIAWVPETHMLKPFDQRTKATFALMQAIIRVCAAQRDAILEARNVDRAAISRETRFPMSWKDSAASDWTFRGYEAATKASAVTGQPRLWYDHSKPYTKTVPIRDRYVPRQWIMAPKAYVIPAGWHRVIERLTQNRELDYEIFDHDTEMVVTAYHIDSFQTAAKPYEGHYRHSAVHVTPQRIKVQVLKGDYVFPLQGNMYKRSLVELLEPENEDSYFAWNFFDAVLQQKEWYSDYRWEDEAEKVLRGNPEIRKSLEAKKAADPEFAKDAAAQLLYVYRQSRWYEPAHMRYPVFRVE